MLEMLRQRRARDEDGFTLIELMVVVLIIAILIAIAIPTFLGAQNRARDRAAQSDLRNAMTAAKTLATDQEGKFLFVASGATTPSVITAAALFAAEASLSFVDGAPDAASKSIGVFVEDSPAGDYITLTRISASGTHFGIKATATGAVTYCKFSTVQTASDLACADTKW